MKTFLNNAVRSLLLLPALVLGISFAAPALVSAAPADCTNGISGGISGGADCAAGSGQATNLFGTGGIFRTITNVLLYIIGAVAVIMLIIGGIRYIVSGGDQAAVTGAKNTILYAVIGLIVAIIAYAIVNFVIGSFVNNGSGTGA